MFFIRRPQLQDLEEFLNAEARCEHSYAAVGCTKADLPVRGFDRDCNRVLLGQGTDTYAVACQALREWRQFPAAWTAIEPAAAPLTAGTTVAMLCRVFGLWWRNSCRIVFTFDEAMPVRRFGFAYGTLPGHVERGEERFSIECDVAGNVWYEILAYSRPRFWGARLLYPIVRRLQRRFVRDSRAAMKAYVSEARTT